MKQATLLILSFVLAVVAPVLADELPSPKAPLQVVKYIQVNSSVKDTWKLIGNHEALPQYAPFIQAVSLNSDKAVAKGHKGSIRECSVNGMGPVQEKISSYSPPNSYSYSAFSNPMGMTNHLATVELLPAQGNTTLIVWKQYFDHPQAPMVAQQIDGMLNVMGNGLKQQLAGR